MTSAASGDALTDFLDAVLGPHRLVEDHSWPHGTTRVLRVEDESGATWFVKEHRDPARYEAELSAYLRWVPALGGHAPRLLTSDDARRTLVLSAVPGRPGLDAAQEVDGHHQAGALLRRLHAAEPLAPWPDFAADTVVELDGWAARSAGLVDVRDLARVRGLLLDLAAHAPARVPCHRDYIPRNWLVADGRVHVIDFEWAAPELWVNDLGRLYVGAWRHRPDLQEAFLDGYGRDLGPDDLATLLACAAVNAVRLIVLAHDRGDAEFELGMRAVLTRLVTGAR